MLKILNIQDSIVDVFNGYACTISIIIDKPEGEKWFVQNYLNYMTTYNSDYSQVVSDYFYSDFTYNSAINFYQPENIINLPYDCYSASILEVQDIIKFMKEKINMGFYLCFFVNLKYLESYNQKEDFIHDIFVYGYDDEKEIVYATGYNHNGKYSFFEHKYNEIVMAYENCNVSSFNHDYFDTKKISYFRYRTDFKYDFNLKNFIVTLKEYLNIYNYETYVRRFICRTEEKSSWKTAYGIGSIKVLIEYFKNLNDRKKLDLRQIYFLYNHKVNMEFKIKYLLKNKYLVDESILEQYREIIQISKICLNLSIKYSLKGDIECLHKIIAFLEELYKKEKDTLSKLVKALEKFC